MEIGKDVTIKGISISDTMDAQQCTYTHYDGTSTPPKKYPDYCPHRLPCGYCRVLFHDCPKVYVTTRKVTC